VSKLLRCSVLRVSAALRGTVPAPLSQALCSTEEHGPCLPALAPCSLEGHGRRVRQQRARGSQASSRAWTRAPRAAANGRHRSQAW